MSQRKKVRNSMDDLLSGLDLGDVQEPAISDSSAIVEELREEITRLKKELDAARDMSDEVSIQQLQRKVHNAEHGLIKIGNSWRFRRFELTPTHIVAPDDLSEDEANLLGQLLSAMDSAINFWIGDWCNMYLGNEDVDQVRGQRYQELHESFGIPVRTLQDASSVCRILPVSERSETVHFSHHRLIAFLPKTLKGREQEFLSWVESTNASVRDLKAYIKSERLRQLGGSQTINSKNYLFSKERIPRVNKSLEKQWLKAKSGDTNAQTLIRGEIAEMRRWLDELETSIG